MTSFQTGGTGFSKLRKNQPNLKRKSRINYFKDFLVKIPGLQSDIPIKQTVRILGPYTFGCYFYVPFHFKHRSSILNRMTFIVEYQHNHSDFKIKLLHASILPDDDYWRSSVYKYKTDYCEAGVL